MLDLRIERHLIAQFCLMGCKATVGCGLTVEVRVNANFKPSVKVVVTVEGHLKVSMKVIASAGRVNREAISSRAPHNFVM